ACMVELASPIGAIRKSGRHGNVASGVGVTLSELRRGSIVEVASWPGCENDLLAAINAATALKLPETPGSGLVSGKRTGFGIGPGRYLLSDEPAGLASPLADAVSIEIGTITDLSHGRTALRIAGPRAEWVLAKLFAIDFALPAFAVGDGKSTAHHDILTQIQR